MTERELLAMQKFGRQSLEDLKQRLQKEGLSLMPEEEVPLARLGLSTRVYQCLTDNNVTKLGELPKRPQDLMAIKGIGKESLEEIESCLLRRGLYLVYGDEDETVEPDMKVKAEVQEDEGTHSSDLA